MDWVRVTIRPTSAFGTPLRGDTLFGQMCWAARHRFGVDELTALLDGYLANQPYLIVSDGFPAGYLPRPELSVTGLKLPAEARKGWKRRRWLPLDAFSLPMGQALERAIEREIFATSSRSHNSISRRTGTTGAANFAPFQAEQLWPIAECRIDIHALLAPERLSVDRFRNLLEDVGSNGYGRDGSIGLGRFEIDTIVHGAQNGPARPDALMTIAPSAPQGGSWEEDRCFWRPFTRFGRHGAAGAMAAPFKKPILLADTGAVLTPRGGGNDLQFVGQGLGGDGRLSAAIPATVHQGYAPVVAIRIAS